MKQSIKYTKQDDAIIIECIKSSPDNISYACRIAAGKLRKTHYAISQRYYSVLRKSNIPILGVGSSKGLCVNVKNRKQPKHMTFPLKLKEDWIKASFMNGKKEDIIEFFLGVISEEEKNKIISKIYNRLQK